MSFSTSVPSQHARLGKRRSLFLRRAIPLGAASLMAALALTVPRALMANEDEHGRVCSNRTLRGDYGILVSGIAPTGPTQTERFVGTALRTYDGRGTFTHIANTHGQISGTVVDSHESGTYEVNADCTGTATLFIPGIPFPIVSSFVIVDQGREVDEAVLSPPPNLVTAVQRRVGP
jgi:hypothetical protein